MRIRGPRLQKARRKDKTPSWHLFVLRKQKIYIPEDRLPHVSRLPHHLNVQWVVHFVRTETSRVPVVNSPVNAPILPGCPCPPGDVGHCLK